ncbi:hypothetical protein LC613_43370 [Nostoc sphaeroides CHAB 2801]|uniref:hypothetical protein n=1 Tax=Nostoc sphaeroides TaxID=446679 RepID=UPI001E2B7B78|nr:hypothetical protein [Nostoc sphaeroides]MCC5634244.1 hypothetical protein [Nostoc sphaeroides CHAB 2801]
MTLDYRNPNDWCKSPLTDRALRLQQIKAESPQQWAAMMEEDGLFLQELKDAGIINNSVNAEITTEELPYPPFTGTEFLATHETIDDHPYSAAFGQFLGNGIDADIANILAFGENRFDLISEDLDDPVRQLALEFYSRFKDMGYWDELPQESSDIDYDNIPY